MYGCKTHQWFSCFTLILTQLKHYFQSITLCGIEWLTRKSFKYDTIHLVPIAVQFPYFAAVYLSFLPHNYHLHYTVQQNYPQFSSNSVRMTWTSLFWNNLFYITFRTKSSMRIWGRNIFVVNILLYSTDYVPYKQRTL